MRRVAALASVAAVVLSAMAFGAGAGAGAGAPRDLHKVRWGEVTIPGSICGAEHPIQLHRGRAVVASRRFPPYRRIHVNTGWNGVVYGDLNGDGTDEAAFQVNCSNGSGTAGGVLAYAAVAFTGFGGGLRVVGVVTARQRYRRGTRHAPIVGVVKIRPRRIIAPEFWYGPNDSVCCPSGRARTIWTYASGTLRPTRTIIERRPKN